MTELGDLLELLHGAAGRWQTARLVVRQWSDSALAGEAMRRFAERRSGSTSVVTARGHADSPTTWESVSRLWIDRPGDRSRAETSGPHRDTLTVRDGSRWWSYTPHTGAISNEEEPRTGIGGGTEADWLLDPAPLLAGFDFSVTGDTEVAGRPAMATRAVPRPVETPYGLGPLLFGGGDEIGLAVDRERGVVLRAESRLDGRPFRVHEVLEAAFDERFDGGLFRFVSPDGSPVRSPRESFARPEFVSVEEAARRARFTVLVPERMPQGWSLDVAFSAATDRPRIAESVTLHLRDGTDFAPRLRIHESADPMRDNLDWQEVDREGRRLLVYDDGAPGAVATVKAQIDGTHVRASGTVDREAMLDVVAGLRPAPTELPPLTSR